MTGDPTTKARETADTMVAAGRLTLAFGGVDRMTYHPDGVTPESDTDHTVMLGVIACSIAARHFPQLDIGVVAQYALVHDLVETYAGDTPTLRLPTADAKAEKQARERAAYERIAGEFGNVFAWLPATIGDYEKLKAPEARFVKAVDKMMPKLTHLLNGAVTIRKQGMDRAELRARLTAQVAEMRTYADDFPELFDVYDVLAEQVIAMAPEQTAGTTAPNPPEVHRPWCGAPRELGGQQPCPVAEPCDARTCRIGSAVGSETYRPATDSGSLTPNTAPYLSGGEAR